MAVRVLIELIFFNQTNAYRYSRERSIDSATPLLSHNRLLPPGGTKYSAQKSLLWTPRGAMSGLSVTPTFSAGFKRSNSLSNFGSRVSISKSPLAERKHFQKQLGDKKWLAERHSKIQDYIRTSGLFDRDLAGSLRPPTISIFIELITKLLNQIFKHRVINSSNYSDILIADLKLLKYPGQIKASVIKSIYTSWPDFIAIISFLLDKANLINMEMEFKAQLDDDYKLESNLQDAGWQFWTDVGLALASSDSDQLPEITETYSMQLKSNITTLIGADFDAVQKLEEREASEQAELDSILAKVEENRQMSDKLNREYLERQQVIDQYEANKGNREKEIKEEVETLKQQVICQKEQINELHSSINNLEIVISKQTYTVKQKQEILNQIDELKRLIGRRKMNAAKLRQQHDEMDIKLGNALIEIERKVDKWNLEIQQTLLPELIDLKLTDRGFHKPDFFNEILKIRKIKIQLEKRLLNEYKENDLKIEKLQNLKVSMENKKQTLSVTRKEVDNLRQTLKILEQKKEVMVSDFDVISKALDSKVKKSCEMKEQEIKEQKRVILDMTNEIIRLIEKTEEIRENGFADIIKAHDAAISDFQESHDIKQMMFNGACDALEMHNQQCKELFGHFRKLLEGTAKLYASLKDPENMFN